MSLFNFTGRVFQIWTNRFLETIEGGGGGPFSVQGMRSENKNSSPYDQLPFNFV